MGAPESSHDELAIRHGQPLASLSPAERRNRTEAWRRHVQARLAGGTASGQAADAVQADLEQAGFTAGIVGTTTALVDVLRGDDRERPLFSEDQAWIAGRPPDRSPYRTRPLEPLAIERLRSALGRRGATLVSVLAYCGLAPDEAFALRWSDVGDDDLSIETGWARRSDRGRPVQRRRSVRLLSPVASDLETWRGVTSHPAPADPVFPHAGRGEQTGAAWRHWRRRRLVPALERAGLPTALRVSDLRHTFALLLIEAGIPLVDVARETGHGPLVTLSMYRDLVDRVGGEGARPPEVAIAGARRAMRP